MFLERQELTSLQWFCEKIPDHRIGQLMFERYFFAFYTICNEEITDIYVTGPFTGAGTTIRG